MPTFLGRAVRSRGWALSLSVWAGFAMAGQEPLASPDIVAAATRFSQSCHSGLIACLPGKEGPGGCWKPAYSQCYQGAVFPAGNLWCSKGAKGLGGHYKPAYFRCEAGKLVK